MKYLKCPQGTIAWPTSSNHSHSTIALLVSSPDEVEHAGFLSFTNVEKVCCSYGASRSLSLNSKPFTWDENTTLYSSISAGNPSLFFLSDNPALLEQLVGKLDEQYGIWLEPVCLAVWQEALHDLFDETCWYPGYPKHLPLSKALLA